MTIKLKLDVNKKKLRFFCNFYKRELTSHDFVLANRLKKTVEKNWQENQENIEKNLSLLFPNSSELIVRIFLFPENYNLGACQTKDKIILLGQKSRSRNFYSAILAHELTHILLSKQIFKRKPIIDEVFCLLVENTLYQLEETRLTDIWKMEELDNFHQNAMKNALLFKNKTNLQQNVELVYSFLEKHITRQYQDIKPPIGLLNNLE